MAKQSVKNRPGKAARRNSRDAECATRTYDYLMSVFQSSPVAFISLDSRLRIMLFNRSAQELTGFEGKEMFGRRVTNIIERSRLRRVILTLRGRDELSSDGYITKLRGKNGADIPVRVKVSPLIGKERKLLGVLVIATDLREVKRCNHRDCDRHQSRDQQSALRDTR